MAAPTLDTLATAHTLEAAGIERQQAEAIATALCQATDANREELVTKADLAALKADLKAEFADLRAYMLKLAIGIVAANAGLTVALIQLLP